MSSHKYDKYNELFSVKGDSRPLLMIHVADEVQENIQSTGTRHRLLTIGDTIPVFFGSVPKQMKFANFEDFSSSKDATELAKSQNIHNEWLIAFIDFITYANTVNELKQNGIIKNLYKELFNEKLTGNKYEDHKLFNIKNLARAFYKFESKSEKIEFNDKILNKLFVDDSTMKIVEGLIDPVKTTSTSGTTSGTTHLAITIPSTTATDISKIVNTTGPSDFIYFKEFANHLATLLNANNFNNSKYKRFNYNPSKFLIFDDDENSLSSGSRPEFWYENNKKMKRYIRKADGKLYEIKNGEEIIVDAQHARELWNTQGCSTVGMDPSNNDKERCADFIQDCLSGKNIQKCKEFLMDSNNKWSQSDEIKKMTPFFIIKFINALKIPKKSKYLIEDKIFIDELLSFEEWLQSLLKTSQLNNDDAKSIRSNTNLKTFIEKLIAHVNSEPAILNKSYIDNTKVIQHIRDDIFSNTTLYKFGLRPNFPRNYTGKVEELRNVTVSEIERLFILLKRKHNQVFSRLGLAGGSKMIQAGGALNNIYDEDVKYTYDIFNEYFEKLNEMLLARKKKLDPEDKRNLEKYLGDLKISEKNLRKAFRIIDEYSRLVYNLGENYDETLNLEKLEELTKTRDSKYLRVANKQIKSLELLRTFAEQVIDGESTD